MNSNMTSLLRSVHQRICKTHCSSKVALNQFIRKAYYAEDTKSSDTIETQESEAGSPNLEELCNVSRLRKSDYRITQGLPPYENLSVHPYHATLTYKRKLYGKYGNASGIDPALCFMTKKEIEHNREYEKVAFEKSIIEIRDAALKRLAEEKEQYRIREEEVEKKLKGIQEWKQRLRDKMNQKANDADKAKEERARLLEEVRRYFGYTIDFKDEKFQIMLELKEAEQKKKEREAKKKRKEEILMSKLAALESSSDSKDDKKNEVMENKEK